MKRPDFLSKHTSANSRSLVEAFRQLPSHEAGAVDVWLLVNRQFGSLTSAEMALSAWLNEQDAEAFHASVRVHSFPQFCPANVVGAAMLSQATAVQREMIIDRKLVWA